MNIEQYIEHLQNSPSFMRNVAAWRVLPAREARYADFPEGLNGKLVEALRRRGIDRPYIHQRLAIEAAIRGEDFVVVTPTASGKTLCYNVPVVNAVANDPLSCYMSALRQDGVPHLIARIRAAVESLLVPVEALVPYERSDLVSLCYDCGRVNSAEYTEQGVLIRADLALSFAAHLTPYLLGQSPEAG